MAWVFYVSLTTLADRSIADEAEQSRCVNPLRIAAAVAPRSLVAKCVAMGAFGVNYNVKKRIAVPFVVGDTGPHLGEGRVTQPRFASGTVRVDCLGALVAGMMFANERMKRVPFGF